MADFGMSDQELEQMYQEVILDAARNPHGRVTPEQTDLMTQGSDVTIQVRHEYCIPAESQQFNPTCGDHATIHLEISDGSDGQANRIREITWQGDGCSISQASLSIMVDLVEGKTVEEALHLFDEFHALMESRGRGLQDEDAEEELGDALVFQGVAKYPMRIKCALLGWEGMRASVAQAMSQIDKKKEEVG